MKEEFLHFIWKYRLFHQDALTTVDGELVEVINVGEYNTNAGPDFFNARVKIGETVWGGNLEIHVNSSDWNKHNHHNDKAFDSVVLQVVKNYDADVYRTNGEKIPALKISFDANLYNRYEELQKDEHWIACEPKIKRISEFTLLFWLEKMLIERFESKAHNIFKSLALNNNSFEESFYQHLARNFGFKVNALPFEMLAKSLPLKYLGKQKNQLIHLEAMLFGQAGMLSDLDETDEYISELKREYTFLKNKYQLQPIETSLWKYMRLRPVNFPTIRIAQFAALLYQSTGLFSKVIEAENLQDIKKLLEVSTSDYWHTHYTFGKAAKEKVKNLGESALDILLINTIIPFIFVYGKSKGLPEYKDKALRFIEEISAEDNSVIKKWKSLNIKPDHAGHTQALLQLKEKYCEPKLCLYCQIGNQIIRNEQL